jgi:hypothetical protein
MKRFKNMPVWLLILAFSFPSIAYAQSFEGTITYLNDFEVSKKFLEMGLTKEVLAAELKKKGGWFDTVRVSYKKGNYIFLTNSLLKKIYRSSENKIYTFDDPDGEICSVQNAVDLKLNGEPDKPQVTELDSTATILGMPCKIIRMKWPMSQVDFYYNAGQAKVDPSLFGSHSYEGLSEFVSRTKCLPLQIVRQMMGMSLIQTALAIKPQEVKDNLFSIPELVEDKELNALKIPGITFMRIKK